MIFLGDGAVSDETGEKTIKSRGMTLTSDVAESKAFKINTRQALKSFIFSSWWKNSWKSPIVFASAKVGVLMISFSVVLITCNLFWSPIIAIYRQCYDQKMKLSVFLLWQMQRQLVLCLFFLTLKFDFIWLILYC